MFLELSKRNVVECGRNNAKCVIFKMSLLQVQGGKIGNCITISYFSLSCFRNRSPRNRRTKIPIRPRKTAGV